MRIKTHLDNTLYLSSLWSDLSKWGHFFIVLFNLRNPNLRSSLSQIWADQLFQSLSQHSLSWFYLVKVRVQCCSTAFYSVAVYYIQLVIINDPNQSFPPYLLRKLEFRIQEIFLCQLKSILYFAKLESRKEIWNLNLSLSWWTLKCVRWSMYTWNLTPNSVNF